MKTPSRVSRETSSTFAADRGLELGVHGRELAADHPAHEVVRGHLRGRAVVGDRAVAQDGDRVADGEDLVQAVGDEQHGRAALAQRAHDAEQPLDLEPGERRGGLVHDQHARVEAERLGDLDQLLVGDREAAHGLLGVELDAETVHQLLHRAVQGARGRCGAASRAGGGPSSRSPRWRGRGRASAPDRSPRCPRRGRRRGRESRPAPRRPARRPRRAAARRRASARSSTCRRRSRPRAPGPRRSAVRSRRPVRRARHRRTWTRG